MAEEFQAGGVCGGNWWNSSRNLFRSSPCSSVINDTGSFRWPNHDLIMDMKTTDEWNLDFLHDSGRSEENYYQILQEFPGLNSSMNYQSPKNFSEDYSTHSFKQVNQSSSLDQQPLNSIDSSSEFVPLNSPSYNYTSSLLQTLFDTDSQPQQSLLENQAMNYSSDQNYRMSSTELLPSLTKASSMLKPSLPKQQPANHLQFTSLKNAKPNLRNFSAKHHNEEARELASVAKKVSNEPAYKRPRIETPSPLPTFKVRKEKLGDRITALQQLVSPFGKTDTASVLHEAIDYIKFLHDQVNGLSTPSLKNGSPPLQHQQGADKFKDQEGLKQDLKSRGLCLVPISSTFPVATETTADFWTPTFGGSFR